jgi:hypothetical protein
MDVRQARYERLFAAVSCPVGRGRAYNLADYLGRSASRPARQQVAISAGAPHQSLTSAV